MKTTLIILLLIIVFLFGFLLSPYIYNKIRFGSIDNVNNLKRKLLLELDCLSKLQNSIGVENRKNEIISTLSKMESIK